MIRDILVWPDRRLAKKCEEVTKFDEKLRQLVVDLHSTMGKYDTHEGLPDAAGLAAPQIGVFKNVFAYKLDGEPTCMVNPKLIEHGEMGADKPEGCLSFPGVYIKVPRYDDILVEFQDVDGKVNRLKTEGFTARCIQHEMDHLNGETYLKVLSKLKRDLVTSKLKKAMKRAKIQRQQYEQIQEKLNTVDQLLLPK